MDFLKLKNKKILIFGISNRKSVAFHIAKVLKENGAGLICSVQFEEQKKTIEKYFPGTPVYCCDVRDTDLMKKTAETIEKEHGKIYGLVHSIAFANYSKGMNAFHETEKKDFLEAVEISCFSLIEMTRFYKPLMDQEGSIVTISISTTRMAAENYGYMAPIKAALDSSVCFLAKSLSKDTRIRVNAVGASLLKTSSSAGIPGYIEPYLFAEKVTLRKKALKTEEVANTAVFLLSPASSGINAQTLVVDAGMSVNYFDKEVVAALMKNI